jgi:uracil-DNA glycosylase
LRALIIGQAPSANSDPAEPLSGMSGRRLASLCCLSLEAFLAAYDRANLVEAFPGRLAKGDAFPIGEARRTAALIRALGPRRLVLLGSGVARAFGVVEGAPALRWFRLGPHEAAICPHPSGVCRWWNDPLNVGRARSFWLRLEAARRP